jgi:uncharacterized protein YndB with AHSA1/START domain
MSARPPIVVERLVPAPPAAVFAAWRDPASLRVWMCPAADTTHATAEVDFRVGGRFRIVMHGARDYAHTGEYLEIDPPRRLVFTWDSEWIAPAERRTRVTVTIEPAGARRSRVRLVHDELPDTAAYDGHPQGWTTILEKLASRLAA